MKKIPLGGDKFALVDDDDYEFVSQFRWRLSTDGYAQVFTSMHRLIMGRKTGLLIDHKDRNRLNNQRSNLRFANKAQNRSNSRFNFNKAGFRGIERQLERSHCWRARITTNRSVKYLGSYPKPELAALMYDFWTTFINGEFAQTNFKIVSEWTNPNA